MNWSDLSMSQRSELMSIYLKNGITSLDEMKKHYNSFANGGKLDRPPYTSFLNTLPDNLKNSGTEYNMRRYWELNNYPKDFNEGIQLGMFTKQDNGYHANSVAFNPVTKSYEFMKDRNHPTYNMELDWYYSDDPEAVEFRKKYKYTPGIGMIPDQYTPRRFGTGGPIGPRRFFGVATPEVTDNTVYKPTYGTLLPEVKVTAKGDTRKVNNDYYRAHSRARADLQYKVQTAPGWQLATLGAALPAAFMLAPTVLPAVGKVLTNPLVDAALTTHGAITAPKNIVEGVNEIKEGNYGKGALDLGLTALDLIGAGNLIGRPARLLSKNFRRNLAYRTIFPYDYSFSPKDAKDILKGIWNKQYSPKDIQHVHENHPLRAAAFRKYLDLEDDITRKLFVPRSDGTFNIDPEVAIELNKNVGINTLTGSPLQNLYKGYKRDNIYDIMGGLGGSEVYSLGNRGVFRMTDTWDLQPFKTFEGSPKVRLAHDIENLGTKIRQYTYDKSLLKPVDKLAEKMQYAGDYIKADKSANSWLRNFEIGPILGGKPFNIDARIPININGGFPIYNPIANIPSLEQAIMTKGDKVVFRRVKEPFEQFAEGGPIHIKPENRGKFTALKKRTRHSASWFKENGTPAQKKMAVFALNAKKWKK